MKANKQYDFTRERIIQNRACTRKIGYATLSIAEHARINVERKCLKTLRIYQCPHCKQYHFTHILDMEE